MHVLHVQPCDLADLTLFDEKGNKTSTPDKERQIEALQLLFLILPAPNRSLLKLLLDLLYQTAKKQDKNKMSAHNLALMFAPHILWPRNVSRTSVSGGGILRGRKQRLVRPTGEEPGRAGCADTISGVRAGGWDGEVVLSARTRS